MPLIPAPGRQRQAELCEFEASLVYRGSSQDSQSYTEKPCLKQTNKRQREIKEDINTYIFLSHREIGKYIERKEERK